MPTSPLQLLRSVTRLILETDRSVYSLRPQVIELKNLLADGASWRSNPDIDISAGQSGTPGGVAISPTMAAMCADDFLRTIQFIRGTHNAIIDLRKHNPDRPVRVLYAGCGPFATLAVPVLSVLTESDVAFTILDIHEESIDSVKSVVEKFDMTKFQVELKMQDAGSYEVNPEYPPDVVLMEIMQTCLNREPQVSVTRHLLSQAPQAILIPEEVRVELEWVDLSREFCLNGETCDDGRGRRDRIPLGPVFTLSRSTVDAWQSIDGDRLPGATVQVPESIETRYRPMLFTRICVYKDHFLGDYDSSLTGPRSLSLGKTAEPGDTIAFHYETGDEPKLVGAVQGT